MASTDGTDARVVTVSATYGALGSVIAPRLADALGLRFLDRTISASAAIAESPSDEERAAVPPSRWIASLAQLAAAVPGQPTADYGASVHLGDMRTEATAIVTNAAAEGRILILGRAAAVVLAGRPMAFHIRLDGPVDIRVERAKSLEGIDDAEARRRCEATDRMRELYVRRLYQRDAQDSRLYHLVLDTTACSLDDTIAVLRVAAEAFWRQSAG